MNFIYGVGAFSFILALLAGAAGLVGVFISVTTVPAAVFAVIAVTAGDWLMAFESAPQLLVNLAGIVVAAVLVLMPPTRRPGGDLRRPLTEG